ncbi:MAG: response regulator transcription factor [Deltaproteobacteria bacterium]|nr:response regulator transcription factor [Deltaproteobacteria bacterium]
MINPQQFRLLLAGPRVSRLRPFVVARGYLCDAATSGEIALEHLRATPRHVLLVELELGDMLLADLLAVVNEENLAGAVILLEDPMKSGLIVSTLTRGIDGYVATPPDEAFLFRLIERQLLAQWAIATADTLETDTHDKTRLEKQLSIERAKVTQLIKDVAGLREELAQAQVQAAAAVAAADRAAEARTEPKRPAAVPAPPFVDDEPVHRPDQRTSPRGYDRGELEALLNDDTGGHPTTAATAPARLNANEAAELGFDEPTGTRAGVDLRSPEAAAPAFEEKSESDLFLDLDGGGDEPGEEPTTAGMPPTLAGGLRPVTQAVTKPLADPFEDSLDE